MFNAIIVSVVCLDIISNLFCQILCSFAVYGQRDLKKGFEENLAGSNNLNLR